jgi:hypothetical protein
MRQNPLIQSKWLIVAVCMLLLVGLMSVQAQDEATATPAPDIEFSGEITEIAGSLLTVNGLTVETAGAEIDGTLAVGVQVEVEGVLQADGIIQAYEVDVLDDSDPETTPEPSPTPLPELTPEATPEMTPEATPELTPEATEDPGDDDDAGIIIVIEGPVESININIITIYGIEIEVDEDDPILTVIQIGDVIRVEGELDDIDEDTLVLIAITIIIIDVDIYISDDGDAWRDDDCGNPPPPWAPAHGWRDRCETGQGDSPGRGRGGSGSS